MRSDNPRTSEDGDGGLCAGDAPAVVMRDGRLVFARSGRDLAEVAAALETGEPVDPHEVALALAFLERRGV